MKTCRGCMFAQWELTKSGRLHPSGDGKCLKVVAIPQLPAAYYWIHANPAPMGGWISRKREHPDHCPYWSPKP